MNKKLLLLTIFFLFIFLSTYWLMGSSNDDGEHKSMAYDFGYNPHYASWFRFASQYFAGNPFLWQIMGFLIVGVITSSILFFITKSYWTFLFYFFGSNYFLVMWGTGLYPQALAVIFGLLLVLFRKSWWKQGLVYLLGFGVHGFAPIFLEILWVLLLFQQYLPKLKGWLTCSPIFGYNTPKALMTKIGSTEAGNHFETGELMSFFTKMVPIPFLFAAFYEWFKKKEFWVFIFLLFLFIGGVLQFNERVIWSFAPFVWLGFIPFFKKSKHKRWWVLLALIIGVINFWLFVRLKTGAGC